MPALGTSLDDARADERNLKAELAARQDELRNQTEQCKPAEPSLPAERWSKGDLATLKGCWVLGRDVPMTHSFADGRRERVTIKAGRICFDDQGGGLHEQVTIGPTAKWDCKAPMTAKFWSNGTLVASQPDVICEGEPLVRWAATQLTCQRVNDELALLPGRRQVRPDASRVPPRTLAGRRDMIGPRLVTAGPLLWRHSGRMNIPTTKRMGDDWRWQD